MFGWGVLTGVGAVMLFCLLVFALLVWADRGNSDNE